ncbi:MAG TPA: thiamine phosphate synthase [Desulfobacterales bacterium]|nr:thiamine phosphate synthase [Desulfobacterales bacterium]
MRGLYAITCERGDLGRSHADVARAAIDAGARVVQFRDKERPDAGFLAAALPVRDLCRAQGVMYVVNDRLTAALALEADGVHLGRDDLAQLDGWERAGSMLLGVSVRTPEEAIEAVRLGADYVGVGPVFATGTKPDAGEPIGLDGLRAIRAAVDVPVAAIGGIGLSEVRGVLGAGADAVCAVSAIAYAPDMRAAAAGLAAEVTRWA